MPDRTFTSKSKLLTPGKLKISADDLQMAELQMAESGRLNIISNGDKSASPPGFELSFALCLWCTLSGGSGSVESQVRGAGADKKARLLSGHGAW